MVYGRCTETNACTTINAYRVLVGKELLLEECVWRGGTDAGGGALQDLARLCVLDQRPHLSSGEHGMKHPV